MYEYSHMVLLHFYEESGRNLLGHFGREHPELAFFQTFRNYLPDATGKEHLTGISKAFDSPSNVGPEPTGNMTLVC